MPTLTTHQAVCLSFGLDPSKVSAYDRQGKVWGWSANHMFSAIKGFADRRMLLAACYPGAISPVELARWAQTVKWNIPLQLAALAPVPAPVFEDAPDTEVESALCSVIAAGENVGDLKKELEKAGCRFILMNGDAVLHIQDGTVTGKFEFLDNMYSAIVALCGSNGRIAHLVKASNSSGGGARGSAIGSLSVLSAPPRTVEGLADRTQPFPADAVAGQPHEAPRRGITSTGRFSLREPKRVDALTAVIFSVLKDAHDAGEPLPSARRVMDLCRAKNPDDITEVTHDEIKFLNDDGKIATANVKAVRQRIERMTEC